MCYPKPISVAYKSRLPCFRFAIAKVLTLPKATKHRYLKYTNTANAIFYRTICALRSRSHSPEPCPFY